MIRVCFSRRNTAGENSAAWARAVEMIPSDGAQLVLPAGEFHHNGLELNGKSRVTIVGGDGDMAKSARTRLLCDNPEAHGIHLRDVANVTVVGIYSNHSVPSARNYAAFATTSFLEVTFDRVTTWLGEPWGHVSGSDIGVLFTTEGRNSGGPKLTNSTLMQHRGAGLVIFGASDTWDVQEASIFDNAFMDNSGAGIYIGDWTGGMYISRNSMWHNGCGVLCFGAAPGATHDVFLTANIIDMSLRANFYSENVDSGHLRSNWFSHAGQAGEAYNIDVVGSNTDYMPVWEVSDNSILSVFGGVRFTLNEARIHNNTIKGANNGHAGVLLTEASADVSVMANYLKGHTPTVDDRGTGNQIANNAEFGPKRPPNGPGTN
jgi:hypothetical protein